MLILTWLNIIFSLVGLAGNAVVLWLLGFCMHRNVVSVYILNLAGADFLFLGCHITGCVNDLIYAFNFTSLAIYKFLFPVIMCSYITGLSMLSAISAERCLSVLWPIWHRLHRPRHMSAVICALLWALSLLLSILAYVYCYLSLRFSCYPCPTMSFITAAWLLFLFVVLCGSSLALLVRMLCGSTRLQLTRLYVTIGLTVLVFLLCGLPAGILVSLLPWFTNTRDYFYYALIAVFMSGINSSINPFIYFFVGSFKQNQHQWQQGKSLKLILKKALESITEVDKSSVKMSGFPPFSVSVSTNVHS
ncbi:Mas-related G-protein coupled receptor member X1 [Heterocephalus glaber]|uniref:Mas-related G-protein coupled receptor member X1 n=1 Tax=Heterocephalus glaber TaxID=10181 RepID=G5AR13_HETGA|nr:Mas-related G-protein coupled receptor member X1 [Heterocephalus glaber]